MKLINDLIGVAVLTSPLWIFVILLLVAIVVAGLAATRIKRGPMKILASIGIFLVVTLLPFADAVYGRIYLDQLCKTKAGAKVYHIIDLPKEYWDAEGKPRFLRPNGDLDKAMLGANFREPAIKRSYIAALGLDEYRHQVVDTSTDRIVGEVINFMHWGGWIARNLSPQPSATRCKNLQGTQFWSDFYASLFRQTDSEKK